MNAILRLLLPCCLIMPLCAEVKDEYLLKLPALTTLTNKTYQQVVVTEKRPDGVTIRHEDGMARIPYEVLPDEVIRKLGGFNGADAAAWRAADQRAMAAAEEAEFQRQQERLRVQRMRADLEFAMREARRTGTSFVVEPSRRTVLSGSKTGLAIGSLSIAGTRSRSTRTYPPSGGGSYSASYESTSTSVPEPTPVVTPTPEPYTPPQPPTPPPPPPKPPCPPTDLPGDCVMPVAPKTTPGTGGKS